MAIAKIAEQRRKEALDIAHRAQLERIKRIAGYVRTSSDKQKKEQTIDHQKRNVSETISRVYSGVQHEVVGIFEDDGYSLEVYEEHRQIFKIIKKMDSGEINVLVLSAENRIFRSRDPELRNRIILALVRNNVEVITPTLGPISGQDPMFGLLIAMLSEMSAQEKKNLVRNMYSGKITRAINKKLPLSTPPYGIRSVGEKNNPQYEIIDREIAIVKDVFGAFTGDWRPSIIQINNYVDGVGVGVADIVRALNAISGPGMPADRREYKRIQPRKISTLWNYSNVDYMLRNRIYIGIINFFFRADNTIDGYKGSSLEQNIQVPHLEAIPPNTFVKAQKIIEARESNTYTKYGKVSEHALLHKILKCPYCKANMVINRIASKKKDSNEYIYYYACERTRSKYNYMTFLGGVESVRSFGDSERVAWLNIAEEKRYGKEKIYEIINIDKSHPKAKLLRADVMEQLFYSKLIPIIKSFSYDVELSQRDFRGSSGFSDMEADALIKAAEKEIKNYDKRIQELKSELINPNTSMSIAMIAEAISTCEDQTKRLESNIERLKAKMIMLPEEIRGVDWTKAFMQSSKNAFDRISNEGMDKLSNLQLEAKTALARFVREGIESVDIITNESLHQEKEQLIENLMASSEEEVFRAYAERKITAKEVMKIISCSIATFHRKRRKHGIKISLEERYVKNLFIEDIVINFKQRSKDAFLPMANLQ